MIASIQPRVIAASVALLASFAAGWQVQAWRYGKILADERQAVTAQTAAQYQASLSQLQAALTAADEAVRDNQRIIATLRRDRDKWREQYRSSLKDDPECEDWSQQLVRCPLPPAARRL